MTQNYAPLHPVPTLELVQSILSSTHKDRKGSGLHIDSLIDLMCRGTGQDPTPGTETYTEYVRAIFSLHKAGSIYLEASLEDDDTAPRWDVRESKPVPAKKPVRATAEPIPVASADDVEEALTLQSLAKAMKKMKKRLKRLETEKVVRSFVTNVASDQGLVEQPDGSTTLGNGGPTVDRGIREGVFGLRPALG